MDIGDSLGHSIPPKRKPIIIESNTDQVDLSSQLVAPIAYQYFGEVYTNHIGKNTAKKRAAVKAVR